jgi:hypothetical protein
MYAKRYVIIIFCRNFFDHVYLGLDYRLIQSGIGPYFFLFYDF